MEKETYQKLELFTIEELKQQYKEGKIDLDFMFEYIVKIDEVYNKLIDITNYLETENMQLKEENMQLKEKNKSLKGNIKSIANQSKCRYLDILQKMKQINKLKK